MSSKKNILPEPIPLLKHQKSNTSKKRNHSKKHSSSSSKKETMFMDHLGTLKNLMLIYYTYIPIHVV